MQKFLIPVQTPVLNDRLVIEAWDYNSVSSDSHIGSILLSVKQLVALGSQPGGFFIWKNLYGAPQDNTGKAADAMNENPDIASDWKGQILMHISAEENDKPKKGVENIDSTLKEEAKEKGYYTKEDYQFLIEVGQGITLPEKDKDYKVCVSIENHDWYTELPKEKKGEYLRWSSRSEQNEKILQYKLPKNEFSIFTHPQEQLKMQDEFRLFIYLMDEEENPICFWHGPLSDFRDIDAKWKWI